MKTWTRVKYVDDFVLYPKPLKSEEGAAPITGHPMAELAKGPSGFVEVILADGRRGFVDGQAKVTSVKHMELRQIETPLYQAASKTSPVISKLKRRTILLKYNNEPVLQSDGAQWVPVSTAEGQHGYILGNVKVEILKPKIETEPADGTKNMLIGGGICGVGIVITAVTYSSASTGGGSYVVAWGAILFGGIRFIWGLLQAGGAQLK
jgi:hypothetical protein